MYSKLDKMRRLFLVVMVVMAVTTVAAQSRGARMCIRETSYDFGSVPRKGGDVAHWFDYENTGDEPLVVMDVLTSCSCIKATFSRRPVRAGGRGVIKILYQPHKMEAGVFHKIVRVKSNSADGVKLIALQGVSEE